MSFCLRSATFNRRSQQYIKFYPLLGLVRARSPTSTSLCLHSRRNAGSIGGPSPGQIELQGKDAEEYIQSEGKKARSSWSPTLFKIFESAATAFVSILVLGLAGYGYHRVCTILEQTVSV